MKSSTSRSLLPLPSCSRIWRRRSTARSAFESASVWFWHTRQRSSEDRSITRLSSTGSVCAMTLPVNSNSSKILFTGELPDQRQDSLREDLAGDRADLLVANEAALVDHIGLGHAVNAVIDANAPFGVDYREAVRIAVGGEPAQTVLALVLVVKAVERHCAALRQLEEDGMLVAARYAPRCPDVQQPDAAQALLRCEALVGLAQERQLERRCRFADERRGHFARVERQAGSQQRQQCDEDAQYPEGAPV